MGLPTDPAEPGPMVVELNLRHAEGLDGAEARFRQLYEAVVGPWEPDPPELVASTYFRCDLSMAGAREMVRRDQADAAPSARAIYRVWPDFPVRALLDRSVATVKADAARRSYEASGSDITWAVIDSGIDAGHPHFATYDSLGGDVARLHRDFTGGDAPLEDRYGHGTHVAGIIAGGLPPQPGFDVCVGQRVVDELNAERIETRDVADPQRLSGVAPRAKLVSLKVLDDTGTSRSTSVLAALQYVREKVNGHGKLLRIQGVNLSLGYEFDARWFACGQSPLCVEVDRLVQSGVVVVVAAGNTGYGELSAREGLTSTGLSLTINDPGNAALAVTVGATHRDSPHTYGVSYFSSKGPTGDGRLKPDLVAPGERITSCAAGRRRDEMASLLADGADGAALYVDDSGTSMAAPHVSGAVAAFLSIRQEFIGRPDEVKRLFLANATSLGRERYFEGHGMVDLMRVIQAV
ncbi:MAG: S8 family peptidase [Euzebyales bacterium]|nr:S8 family peptidase [Euzebyales bacterium]